MAGVAVELAFRGADLVVQVNPRDAVLLERCAKEAWGALQGSRAVRLEPVEAVRRLIDRAAINAVPGHLFHAEPDGVRTIRFHFAVAADVLDELPGSGAHGMALGAVEKIRPSD